jgi:hypothetical protein
VRSALHVIGGIAGLRIDKSMLQAVQMPMSKRKAPDIRRRTRGLP